MRLRDESGASVEVRRAEELHAATITGILSVAFEPLRGQYTAAAYAATVISPAAVRDRMSQGPVWLATVAGVAVGTFSARPDDRGCYLRGMAVAPSRRGSGVGRALLDGSLEYATEVGAPAAWLHTTPFLHAARRLYEGAGFVVDRDRPPADLHGTPLLAMTKLLR